MEPKNFAVQELQHYHRNARRGNVQAIAESLRINGQYKPIVVNAGSKTGRENEVLVGNHTLDAMIANGGETIKAIVIDVTDEEARRIVLADNRTSDLGSYDNQMLLDLLDGLDDLTGTAFTEDDLDSLTSLIDGQDDLFEPESKELQSSGHSFKTLDILVGEPTHTVKDGDVYRLGGRHYLVIAKLATQHDQWVPLLPGRIFAPYPDMYLPLGERAKIEEFVFVQPNHYLAGHLLDKWASVNGESSIEQIEGAS